MSHSRKYDGLAALRVVSANGQISCDVEGFSEETDLSALANLQWIAQNLFAPIRGFYARMRRERLRADIEVDLGVMRDRLAATEREFAGQNRLAFEVARGRALQMAQTLLLQNLCADVAYALRELPPRVLWSPPERGSGAASIELSTLQLSLTIGPLTVVQLFGHAHAVSVDLVSAERLDLCFSRCGAVEAAATSVLAEMLGRSTRWVRRCLKGPKVDPNAGKTRAKKKLRRASL